MSTPTTTYSFDKPTVGGDVNTWGTLLNGNWDAVDDLFDGTTPVSGIDINGGSIDGTPIGAATPSTGAFTTLSATTPLPVASGGTGAATAPTALAALGLTATAAELNTLDGVTANVSELNLLAGKALSGADASLLTGTSATAGNLAAWNADGDLVDGGAAISITNSTYTATLTPSSSGSITLDRNVLNYYRIGDLVTVTGGLRVGSVSSPVGSPNLNLPFAIAPSASLTSGNVGFSVSFFDNSAGTWASVPVTASAGASQAFVVLPVAPLNNDLIEISFSYVTDA